MKHIVVLLALTFSTTIFAKQVELELSILYKKGDIATKIKEVKIIANMDKEFNIPNTDGNPFNMKLNVSEFKEKIDPKMDTTKSLMVKGNFSIRENGKMKIIATPQVITMIGNEATISTQDEDGTYFEMKVLPVKTSEKL